MKKLTLLFCAIITINVTMAQQIIELDVWSDKTPPALLFHSLDNTSVPIENSKRYRDALLAKEIPAELITYPTGGRGWGFNSNMESRETMKAKLLKWIKAL